MSSRLMFSESEWPSRAQYALLTATNSSVVFPMPANLIGLVIGGNPLPASVLVPRLGDIEALDEVQLSLDPRTGQAFKSATLDSFVWHTVADFQLTDKVALTVLDRLHRRRVDPKPRHGLFRLTIRTGQIATAGRLTRLLAAVCS